MKSDSQKYIPVFHPTWSEFENFNEYIHKLEVEHGAHHSGVCKIVPPAEWKPRSSSYDSLDTLPIPCPMRQRTQGCEGIYRVSIDPMPATTVAGLREHATAAAHRPPNHLMESHDWSAIEKLYWTGVGNMSAVYGADVCGSVTDPDQKSWNIAHLGSILDEVCSTSGTRIEGVSTPYLYIGTFRASFVWHVEDEDLYSINYVHFGAPKHWYSIPPAYARRFESFAREYFKGDYTNCQSFIRHKTSIISPQLLQRAGIPVLKTTQEAGQIIITFPRGYHSGFNMGFNLAESTNFAQPRWVEYVKTTDKCLCRPDSVRFNVEPFVARYQPERLEAWLRGEESGFPHPVDAEYPEKTRETVEGWLKPYEMPKFSPKRDDSKLSSSPSDESDSSQRTTPSLGSSATNDKKVPLNDSGLAPKRRSTRTSKVVDYADSLRPSPAQRKGLTDTVPAINTRSSRSRTKAITDETSKVLTGEEVQEEEVLVHRTRKRQSMDEDDTAKTSQTSTDEETETVHVGQRRKRLSGKKQTQVEINSPRKTAGFMNLIANIQSLFGDRLVGIDVRNKTPAEGECSTEKGMTTEENDNVGVTMRRSCAPYTDRSSTDFLQLLLTPSLDRTSETSEKIGQPAESSVTVNNNSALTASQTEGPKVVSEDDQASNGQTVSTTEADEEPNSLKDNVMLEFTSVKSEQDSKAPDEQSVTAKEETIVVSSMDEKNEGSADDDVKSEDFEEKPIGRRRARKHKKSTGSYPRKKRKVQQVEEIGADKIPAHLTDFPYLWFGAPRDFDAEKDFNAMIARQDPHCAICALLWRPARVRDVLRGTATPSDLPSTVTEPLLPEGGYAKGSVLGVNDLPPSGSRLLRCTRCCVSVHARCYGAPHLEDLSGHSAVMGPTTPPNVDDWMCDSCDAETRDGVNVQCCLCPLRGGALKLLSGGLDWGHVVCSLTSWDIQYLHIPSRLALLPPADAPNGWFVKPCAVCDRRTAGVPCNRAYHAPLVRCGVSQRCYSQMHVTCAQMAGLLTCMGTSRFWSVLVACPKCTSIYAEPEKLVRSRVSDGDEVYTWCPKTRGFKPATAQRMVRPTYYSVDFLDGTFSSDVPPKFIMDHNCEEDGPPKEKSEVRVLWHEGEEVKGIFREVNEEEWELKYYNGSVVIQSRDTFYKAEDDMPFDVKKQVKSYLEKKRAGLSGGKKRCSTA